MKKALEETNITPITGDTQSAQYNYLNTAVESALWNNTTISPAAAGGTSILFQDGFDDSK